MRALPLSLDPLPDEGLPGYLLRLSHRAGVQPAQMAMRVGIARRNDGAKISRIATNLLFEVPDERLEVFTRTTRLTRKEATDLLLAPLASRYGPLGAEYQAIRSDTGVPHNNPWVFRERVRYCPSCLAGEGSAIEQAHGGAWQRMWRLPPVFACVRHRQLLRHACHACDGLVQAGGPHSMIARLRDPQLHPVQCRATLPSATAQSYHVPLPACGADLTAPPHEDSLGALDPQTRELLLRLQQRLLTLLSPAASGPQTNSVGWLIPTGQYFMDLKAVSALIFMTWPAARLQAQTARLRAVLDAEAERRHALFHAVRQAPGKGHASRAYSDPPQDPLTAGAVLEMADRLLTSPHEDQASVVLAPIAALARDMNAPLSYQFRTRGTSFPLQVVLLTRRRGKPQKPDTTTAVLEAHGNLVRAPDHGK